jgi:hypothetical protein
MTHSLPDESTTYVVVSSHLQLRNEVVKERLKDMFRAPPDGAGTSTVTLPDPFMLHIIITHEAFLDAKSVITRLRYKLYDALDGVDNYSKEDAGRRTKDDLERLTIQLHVASQDTDSLMASADMAGMLIRRMSSAHQRYANSLQSIDKNDGLMKTTDAISYLSNSIESQLRWLNSYKSRKNIAMNLVRWLAATGSSLTMSRSSTS